METLATRTHPKITIAPSARPVLTDGVRAAVDGLLKVLESEAARHLIPVTKIEVARFVDPEEDIDEIVVTQWVDAAPQTALDYWDELGTALEAWIDLLPKELTTIAAERLAIDVLWNNDDTTA